MYTLTQSLSAVKGIGPKLAEKLANYHVRTIKDLLLVLPLRYEDRSQRLTIDQLLQTPATELTSYVTVKATLKSLSNQFKGRFKSIQRATIADETGKLNVIWFNNRFVMDSLKKGSEYYFSGKLNDRHFLTQPKVEPVKEETLHTNRLVPLYSSVLEIKDGALRRILKHILDELVIDTDPLASHPEITPLKSALTHIHFPDDEKATIKALQRLALEELLGLIATSQEIKNEWRALHSSVQLNVPTFTDSSQLERLLPPLPFTLTGAQLRSVAEILTELKDTVPMNRLLLGDVGSGKTAVAGLAAYFTVKSGYNACLIAPTQILAGQHLQTFKKLFPDLPVALMMGASKKELSPQPTLYIGTHTIINKLEKLAPALVIYDEQHRFGVKQRSEADSLVNHPHILTMSATPIPRSLMLSIFSHLQLSVIDELPAGRLPTETWLVPATKREASYTWLGEQLTSQPRANQAILVCPFIESSTTEGFEHIAAATQRYKELLAFYKKSPFANLRITLLHGKMKTTEKEKISAQLYNQEIDILVTTPIVEVGLDLPAATYIVIENAERFGLASLHQLRGRVGRAGQQGYCLLFSASKTASERLTLFSQEHNGLKVAEYDLQNRGAGNIFGLEQHGFDQLRFASWTNLELITLARQLYDQLKDTPTWRPFIQQSLGNDQLPSAN